MDEIKAIKQLKWHKIKAMKQYYEAKIKSNEAKLYERLTKYKAIKHD